VGVPNLISCGDQPETHKGGIALRRFARDRGQGVLLDRSQTHAAQKVSQPIAADRDPFSDQPIHNPAGGTAGIIQAEGIYFGQISQRRLALRCWLMVKRSPWKAQQRTLAADAELRVVVIDQLA